MARILASGVNWRRLKRIFYFGARSLDTALQAAYCPLPGRASRIWAFCHNWQMLADRLAEFECRGEQNRFGPRT